MDLLDCDTGLLLYGRRKETPIFLSLTQERRIEKGILFASNEAYSTRGRRHMQARAFTPHPRQKKNQEKQQKSAHRHEEIISLFPFLRC